MSEITQYLKPDILILINDDDNWSKEEVLNVCKICNEEFDSTNPFFLVKEKEKETWTISLHYECAIKEEFVEELKEEEIEGDVF